MNDRDELAHEIRGLLHAEGAYCGNCDYESASCYECDNVLHRYADAILAAGYRKPRTIPDEHFVSDRYGNYAVEHPEMTIIKAADGSIWYRDEDGDWSSLGSGGGRLSGPATVLHDPWASL